MSAINRIFPPIYLYMRTFYTLLFLAGSLIFGNACSFHTVNNAEPEIKKEVQLYKTQYVVILVIDGPRWTETFGDSTCALIPKMGKELVKDGVLYTNFRNEGSTTTTAGHTAITTGFYQSISNGGRELPKRPSMFQYYLKATNADKSKAWLVSSKGKLEVLANTRDKHWWNMYMPSTYCGPNGNSSSYGGDAATFAKAGEVLRTYHPNLLLINLLEVDTHGHGNDWEGYKRGIQHCDQYAFDLWQLIQSDPELKDRTTLFITNDHGRHLDGHKNGFVNHGDKCEGCRHISLLAMGPDFKKGTIVSEKAEMIDIPATISEMLHFDMPTCNGKVLTSLFQ